MSKLENFVSLLYRSVFPAKPPKPNQWKVPDNPVIAESWESFRHHPGKASIPPYRYHGQYDTPMELLGSIGKYMSRQFNAYCSEMGVQCTVAMDPSDYAQLYHFTNLSDRLILIEHSGGQFQYLEPKESTTIKVRQPLNVSVEAAMPRLTPINNGNPDV